MHMSISALLCIIAIVLFCLAAFGVQSRVALGWLGMAFFAAQRFFVALALCALCLSGCSTLSAGNKAGLTSAGKAALSSAESILGAAATQTLFAVAQQEAMGGKADLEQAAAQGLWSQVNTATISSTIGSIVSAYSNGKATATASEAANAASLALGSGQPSAAVVNAIAGVIATAAGAPPGK